MSLVRHKFFVISNDVVDVIYGPEEGPPQTDDMVIFNTSSRKLVDSYDDDEWFEFLGMGMDELPHQYKHAYYGVNGVVTCFGVEDGIRVTDTDSQGFDHWIYIQESNPLFNLDFAIWMSDEGIPSHKGRVLEGKFTQNLNKFIRAKLPRRVYAAYRAATRSTRRY